MRPNQREILRIEHLAHVLHDESMRILRWAWLRTALLAFVTTFTTTLLTTDLPAGREAIVSSLVAGLSAARAAARPAVPLELVQKHLESACTAAKLDLDPGQEPPADTPH